MSLITLITLDYPPQYGGVARYLGDLVAASCGGIKVIVPEESVSVGQTGAVEGVRLWQKSWPRWWPTVGACRRLRGKTSCLLVSHVFPVGTAALLSRLCGGPEYAVLFHGLDLRLARGTWKRTMLALVCLGAKACVANSQSTLCELVRRVPWVRPLVMTPGVTARETPLREEARLRLGLEKEEAIVLSIARLVPRKGIDVALEALVALNAMLERRRTGVRYVVIGEGEDQARLKRIAEENGAKVAWLGSVTDETKWDWLAAADIFLLPAREDERDMEGFGIVFLEAAQAGVPVVAGQSGGVAEAVADGETGILVDPRSAEEVAAAITRLLDDKDLRHRLGEAGRRRVAKEFGWEERWEKLRDLL